MIVTYRTGTIKGGNTTTAIRAIVENFSIVLDEILSGVQAYLNTLLE